jgi:uncharacterized protein YbjT (DUF2867 family)
MAKRTIIIAGATGLVGKAILNDLLSDDSVAKVHSLGRRLPEIDHPKLTSYIVDFTALPVLPTADELYLALGTTIKVAGSQSAFRAVDFDANLAVAEAALKPALKRSVWSAPWALILAPEFFTVESKASWKAP